MRQFYILWTYLGNYSDKPWEVKAESPEEAAERVRQFFSADFRARGTVYVFDKLPLLVNRKGKVACNKEVSA